MRNKYSRLERHNKKQSNRQAFLYIVLSILFIVGMIKWGLPGMIGLVTGSYQDDTLKQANSNLKPQRPSLEPLPEATYSATLSIAGLAQAETKIKLRMNGLDSEEISTDDEGKFEFKNVELRAGENTVEVWAYVEDFESERVEVTVIQDSEEPKITISSPEEEHKFFGIDQRSLEIIGEVSEEAEITINGNFVHLDNDNKFVYATAMSEGANDYTIKVTDQAGNTTERLFRVFYSR